VKVVFLDFDGVIATAHTYNVWRKAAQHPGTSFPRGRHKKAFKKDAIANVPADAMLLDADCCARVQKLCDLTGAVIVISSSWRHDFTLDQLIAMLASKGITAPVVGATTTEGHHRGQQILDTVTKMGLAPTDIVILEDYENVAPFNGRRIQPTFDGSHAGFQDRHLTKALALFGVQLPTDHA
jgi:hypothetical protein